MYTHCPNCNTHFSITQEYLDIANGKVRCGKCDHVFNALENLYNNDEESDSPQLESAVSIPEEQQTPIIETKTEPAPEAEETIPQETEATSPEHSTDEAETTEANAEPEETTDDISQTTYTPPLASIDIKEKMERIAASLSATTQELKNARKSVGFERQPPKTESPFISLQPTETAVTPPEPQAPVSETETETEKLSETRFENDNDKIQSRLSAEAQDIIAEEQSLEVNNIEAETTDMIEPVESLSPYADTEVSETTEAEPEIQNNLSTREEDQEQEKSEAPENIKSDETENPELSALEDELELVDFSEQLDEEPVNHSAAGHTTVPVDESDIDILQSLIETQQHEDIAPENLIDELNDINKSLSSEDISLDDELDNGDDILAELDQLEQEFNTQDSQTRTETESKTKPDSTDNDFEDTAEHEVAEITQSTAVPVVEEEVVPSFLNQNAAKSGSPASLFGWLFATLLMLLLLAAQYLHFNSMQLADNPDYRSFLETLCPITGCVLPLRKAPDKIITINHDVHTHTSVKDALEIQLSFRNKADFTQQFPVLEVIFSNPRSEIIARRQFRPDEYLNSNISYIAGIKPNQTEKIDLEIVDPDPGALLSFQFNYL